MRLNPASGGLCVLFLAVVQPGFVGPTLANGLELAQAGGNERVPGGVEHVPSAAPGAGAASPSATMPAAPSATMPAEPSATTTPPPVDAAPAPTPAPTPEPTKKNGKPESHSKKKSKSYHMESPALAPESTPKKDGSGGDERRPGGVEHAPATGQ